MTAKLTDAQIARYLRGEVEMKDLLQLTQGHVQALRNRSQILLDEGHDERALVLLEMISELDRGDERARLMAVDVLLGLGRSGEAAQQVRAILSADSESYEGLLARAKVELATGAWTLAYATLQALLQRDRRAETPGGRRAHALAREAHRLFEASR